MHVIRTIVINVHSICESVKWLHCTKMAQWIKVLFGVKTLGSPRNTVLDGGPKTHTVMGRGGKNFTHYKTQELT